MAHVSYRRYHEKTAHKKHPLIACNQLKKPQINCDTSDYSKGAQANVEMTPWNIPFLDGFHIDIKITGCREEFYKVIFPVMVDNPQALHLGYMGLEKGDIYAFSDGAFWVVFAGL